MPESPEQWAERQFGQTQLGHQSRTRAVIRLASGVAAKPAGRLTQVFDNPADLLSGYRLIENDAIDPRALLDSVSEQTARQCRDHPYVLVPVDGSSLSIYDPNGIRDVGTVGNFKRGQPGLKVVNAIAAAPDGTPIGLFDQQWWRRRRRNQQPADSGRSFWQKETSHTLNAVQQVCETAHHHSPSTRMWFQLDRGGDFKELWHWAVLQTDHWVTIRVNQTHRRVRPRPGAEQARLEQLLSAQPIQSLFQIDVPQTGITYRTRRATLAISYRTVVADVPRPGETEPLEPAEMTVIWVREVGEVPEGQSPLEWYLATTAPVEGIDQAHRAVDAYLKRWRIEEFHRAWKTLCRVEDTRLRQRTRIIRWATILAAVAMRIEQLKRISRQNPQAEATQLFSDEEIKAIVALRQPGDFSPGDIPTTAEAVRWLGELGGYANPHQGPPGSQVLKRGLDEIRPLVEILQRYQLVEREPDK